MQIFHPNPKKASKEWSEHYSALRRESRIMEIRRQAIWGNRDPDLAERQYRAAIERNQQKKKKD